MTTTRRIPQDITLTRWTETTTAEEIRSAFRRKYGWVVDDLASPTMRYRTVLSNLVCHPIRPEVTTIDGIRDILIKGLSVKAFDQLKLITAFSSEDLSNAIRISQRTLARRKKFKPDESERILRVASAFQKALEVLGSLEGARRWFARSKKALGGKTPLEFCDTGPGAEEVENLLGRIEHGVFT